MRLSEGEGVVILRCAQGGSEEVLRARTRSVCDTIHWKNAL